MFNYKGIRGLTTLAGVVIMLVLPMQCDNGTNPPESVGPLELLYPKGGNCQSFKVGDTVIIRWSIHDQSKVQAVGMSYSLDGGKTVTNNQIIGNGSVTYPDTTYRLVIDSRFISDSFVLVIWEYNERCLTGLSCGDKPYDKSAPFQVSQ